jgi:hypothetical protein
MMLTLKYDCGFWVIMKDGIKVADTGCSCVATAEKVTGLKVNHTTVMPLDVIAAMVGPEAVETVKAYRESLPKPKPLSPQQQRAQYRRELKGF